MLITIALIVVLLLVFYQDLRQREVLWILFPAICALATIYNWINLTWIDVLLSLSFVAFLMIFLTLYLSLKFKKLIPIWKGFFSLGDILFIVAIIPLFSWMNYIYFFTFGTIAVLVLYLISLSFLKTKTVPYAGYLSLVTVFILLFPRPVFHFFNFLNGN